MTKWFLLLSLLSVVLPAVGGNFNDPAGWISMGKDQHKVTYDKKEKALLISAEAPSERQLTVYPLHRISPEFRKATTLRFDLKLPKQPAKFTRTLLVLSPQKNHNGRIAFQLSLQEEWQTITMDLNENGYDFSKAVNLQFLFETPRAATLKVLLKNIVFLDKDGREIEPAPSREKTREAPLALFPVAPDELYLEPDTVRNLSFRASGIAPREIAGRILNYSGEEFRRVKLIRNPKSHTFTLALSLPRGFYELDIPESGQRFGIVSLGRFQGKTDEFFSIEPLICRENDRTVEAVLELLVRYGIRTFREYHPWPDEEPLQNQWKPAHDRMYEIAARKKLSGTFFFASAPRWTGSAGANKDQFDYQPYPRNLIGVSDSIRNMIVCRRAGTNAFQIWNEPDLRRIPGDQYLSLQIAASYALQQSAPELPLVGCGFSSWLTGESALAPYFNGNMLDSIDIFAFQTYHAPEEMERLLRTFRQRMKQSNPVRAAMPIWVTESGKAWQRNDGRVEKDRAQPGEDMLGACWIVMKGVELKAGGVSKYVPFALKFFPEKDKNFGMTDRYWSPHRSLAAYLFCIHMLSGREYIGDLPLPDGTSRFRVFSGDGKTVGVLYAGDPAPRRISLGRLPVTTIHALDGSAAPLRNDNSFLMTGGISYLELDRSRLSPFLKRDTEMMSFLESARNYRPLPRTISPVVYQFSHWNVASKDYYGYFEAPRNLEFRVFNLGDQPAEVLPYLELPEGGRVLSAPPKLLILPPRTSRILNWQVDLGASRAALQPILLRDRNNPGQVLWLPFLSLEKTVSESLELNKASRWHANTSGTMTITGNPAENAISFSIDFPDTVNAWAYPEYLLNSGESLAGAIGVSFEIKAAQSTGERVFPHQNCMVTYDLENNYQAVRFEPPSEQWEKRTVLFPPDWELKRVRKFRIGLGASAPHLEFSLRNIRFHYLEK